jgi:superfamily I DNA and RNA helicase
MSTAEIESIHKTTLHPEDVIVIRLDKTAVKPAIIESIMDRLRDIFPNNKVIALMHGRRP